MKISKLHRGDFEKIKKLYNAEKFMGVDIAGNFAFSAQWHNDYMLSVFSSTYLTGLNNFHAYGLFNDEDNIDCLISLYDSPDEPAWYYTVCRSTGNKQNLLQLFDEVLSIQENKSRYKFYSLVNKKHSALLRNFTYSDYNAERYGFYDEYMVPAKTRCYYNTAWELLFKKVLLPVDTVVRCSFLKQEYRPGELSIAGGI